MKEIGRRFLKRSRIVLFYLPSSMWIAGVLHSHLKPIGKDFSGTNSLKIFRSASLHLESHVLYSLYPLQDSKCWSLWFVSNFDGKARKVAGLACILTACQSKRYMTASHRPTCVLCMRRAGLAMFWISELRASDLGRKMLKVFSWVSRDLKWPQRKCLAHIK